jgi:glucosamine--fructose-6-phosphate aminotransferase (isomerizing)
MTTVLGETAAVTAAEKTPFEVNILEQPEALRRLADAAPTPLDALTGTRWDRIVLTGMGSSHFAGLPTWRRLVALGHEAWTIDTGQLLDNDRLVTDATLLIVTSQSGASGEVTELLDRRRSARMGSARLVGVANDEASPLARAADVFLPLHSADEATVSTKSYLNTLATHRLVRAAFDGADVSAVRATELADAATAVQDVIDRVDLDKYALSAAQHPARRLAYVGARDSAGTAEFAALITKESAKVAAEGYVGGQFRHGPFELAGDGLTVVIFAPERDRPDASLRRLAADLVDTGSQVIVVGDTDCPATVAVPIGGVSDLAFAAASSVVAELFAVDVARANGVIPGAFVHGSKITTTI